MPDASRPLFVCERRVASRDNLTRREIPPLSVTGAMCHVDAYKPIENMLCWLFGYESIAGLAGQGVHSVVLRDIRVKRDPNSREIEVDALP